MLKILGWVLLGFLLFLLFLLLLPVHTRVRYDGILQVWAGLGPVSLRIFPLKKKPKKEKTQAAVKEKKPKKEKSKKPKKKMTAEIIFDFIRLGAEALGTLRRRLVLQNLTCHLKIGGPDAASAALLYGRIAAGVSAFYPILERNLRIRNTDISVDVDFESDKIEALTDVTLAVCPLRLLLAALILLIHFLKINAKIKKQNQSDQEKGGITHEQHS